MTTDMKVVPMPKPDKPYLDRLLGELAAEFATADAIRSEAEAKVRSIQLAQNLQRVAKLPPGASLPATIAASQQRGRELERQRKAVAFILARPRRFPGCVWHWARAVLPLTQPRGYKLLYRVTERAA